MQVQVEHCAGHLGVEMPVRFRFDARQVEIVENIDRWYGPDYCYFKIKGNDGNLYILRFDEGRAEWELTMFQSPAAHSTVLGSTDGSVRIHETAKFFRATTLKKIDGAASALRKAMSVIRVRDRLRQS